MTTVLVFGTFDVIHPGHISFLKQARARGDRLVVSVARDRFVEDRKGRAPIHTEAQRAKMIRETGLVNETCLSDMVPGTYSVIERIKPDLVCFGHDQHELRRNFESWQESHRTHIPTQTLEAYKPETFKSSKLNQTSRH
jgi:FAD synthetase